MGLVAGPGPNAGGYNGSAVPTIKAEDTVCLGDSMPAFDVMEGGAVRFTRLDVLGIELRLEQANLLIGKCHHLVLTLSTGLGLDSWAPEISPPRFKSPSIAWRSSLGGC